VALLLSILAFVLAGLALGLAWRSHRQTHRLALEMVQLRDRLAAAEAHRHEGAAGLPRVHAATAADPTLAPRIAALEERLHSAPRSAAAVEGAPAADDARAGLRQRLRAEGYRDIAFLDGTEPGDTLVEAERDGVLTKGRIERTEDGSFVLRSISSLRAFP